MDDLPKQQASPPAHATSGYRLHSGPKSGRSHVLEDLDSDHLDSSSSVGSARSASLEGSEDHQHARRRASQHVGMDESEEEEEGMMHETGDANDEEGVVRRRGRLDPDNDDLYDDDKVMGEGGLDYGMAAGPDSTHFSPNEQASWSKHAPSSYKGGSMGALRDAAPREPAIAKNFKMKEGGHKLLDQDYPGKLTYDPFLALLNSVSLPLSSSSRKEESKAPSPVQADSVDTQNS